MNTTMQLGDTVSGLYFGEHAFQGKLSTVDASFVYIVLTTSCHRYAAGEDIAIPRNELTRCGLQTIARPDGVVVKYDATTGARYAT